MSQRRRHDRPERVTHVRQTPMPQELFVDGQLIGPEFVQRAVRALEGGDAANDVSSGEGQGVGVGSELTSRRGRMDGPKGQVIGDVVVENDGGWAPGAEGGGPRGIGIFGKAATLGGGTEDDELEEEAPLPVSRCPNGGGEGESSRVLRGVTGVSRFFNQI